MKNNNDQYEIRKARQTTVRRASTDILVNPVVIQNNTELLAQRPIRKRRGRNYAKKIMNDPFIMNI